ncbi:hypothetical protein [Actinomadura latina]|uniref:Calcium-binding protein n=1 Tax=Actinomadura latina TaxID=163603 RepID=A0A846Z383_9ACTN|nr:hypothetical protein [Actinomadura latina]NKZ06711.1 hypothetical protein [Actinomadura latina]
MSTYHKWVSGAAALAVAGGVLIGGVTAADAASLQFRIEVPRHLTVGKGEYSKSCAMDVWAWGTEGPGVAYSKAYVIEPDGELWPVYKRVLPGAQVGWGVGCPSTTSDLGKWRVRVVAYNKSGKALGSRENYWYEKFDTVVKGFNAAPEPIRKGRTLYVSGRLFRVNNLGTGYTSYSGKAMRVYFRPKGAKSWTYMGSAKTARDGRFRKGFTAKRDGTWRAYFAGTSNFDKQKSRDDYIDVR